ncbi:MAG TPA: hypothetical protein VGQ05_24960 [Streptosporangiaceae bacterium]|jgi:hypothetical protein|nr:hypothetical protein [Streptosporangiaceae bacterium]
MTYQAGPAGPVGQRIKAGPSPWSIVLLVIGVLIGGFGAALGVSTLSSVVAGVVGGVVVLAALAALTSWTEIQGSQITAHSLRGRRILRLDQLASADYAVGRGRYGRTETLTLADQAGTRVALLLNGYSKMTRQRTLAALGPAVMADGVRRTGPVEQAFQGGY